MKKIKTSIFKIFSSLGKKVGMKFPHSSWKRREVILFVEQVSLYLSAGLALNEALGIIGKYTKKHRVKTISQMREDVESGISFGRAFSDHISPKSAVLALIEQGEQSGHLAESLMSAHSLLERSDELTKKCISAIAYPLVIGIFATLLTIGLVRGVMPQIIPLLLSLHVKLPFITRATIFISNIISRLGLWILIFFACCLVGYSYVYKKYPRFRSAVQTILLQIPLIGLLLRLYWSSIFLRSCGSLIGSGSSVFDAYGYAVRAIGIIPIQKRFLAYSNNLSEGSSLSSICREKILVLPAFVSALVSAGESSGSLSASLIRAADIVDRDIAHTLKRLTSLLEPVMMAGMGFVVGGIALSIMMPIYDISKVLQK